MASPVELAFQLQVQRCSWVLDHIDMRRWWHALRPRPARLVHHYFALILRSGDKLKADRVECLPSDLVSLQGLVIIRNEISLEVEVPDQQMTWRDATIYRRFVATYAMAAWYRANGVWPWPAEVPRVR